MSTSASFGPCHLAICQDLQGRHSIICSNLSPRVPLRHGGPSEARGYSCGSASRGTQWSNLFEPHQLNQRLTMNQLQVTRRKMGVRKQEVGSSRRPWGGGEEQFKIPTRPIP